MPSCSVAESVARWPGPVILDERTGSFGSMAVSTTRRPPASTTSEMVRNAPAGSASSGHETSRKDDDDSSLPKRKGLVATTIVCVTAGFFCASRLRIRISAWPLSHDCARNTAKRPNKTATPIITMVLVRTTQFLWPQAGIRGFTVTIGGEEVLN